MSHTSDIGGCSVGRRASLGVGVGADAAEGEGMDEAVGG